MTGWLKVISAVLASVLVLVLATVLGGSAVWVIGGVNSLDIEGRAKPHDGMVQKPANGWRSYGGDPGGNRYSQANDITLSNVAGLKEAWTYSTGDLEKRSPQSLRRSAGETTPILIEDSLIFCSAFNEVIAIDPGSGEEHWRYDPGIDADQRPANQFVCRGVSYWEDTQAYGTCAQRIFSATSDGTLFALDARHGTLCEDFGENGTVTIDPGIELKWQGEFQVTSPPAIIDDIVVVGSAISDNVRVEAPRGSVRAYDARTGERLWWFDPIPRTENEANAGDWQGNLPPIEGHANAWAPISADQTRGLVFIPTSSPSPDFYGGLRPGDNRYANSLVALNAASGEVVWAYQFVHHDVWDYDTPAQPGLYTIWKDGKPRDVVAQITKMGFVFVLDRDTGVPIFTVEERPVPQDGAMGEALSPTQPFPSRPPALIPQTTSVDDAFGLTWFDKRACEKAISALRSDGLYTPPTEQGTLFRPFTGGGGNWGGSAYDASRNLLVVNMSNIAHLIQLVPADRLDEISGGVAHQTGAPYGVRREMLVSPLELPCTAPPWGIIAGVDIAEGEIVWRKTIGTTEDLAEGMAFKWGTPTIGGPIVTATGVLFIASTFDYYLRALNVETGEELWKGRLPTAGISTPMTYMWKGKQYVVVFAGGYPDVGASPGDSIIAFASPE